MRAMKQHRMMVLLFNKRHDPFLVIEIAFEVALRYVVHPIPDAIKHRYGCGPLICAEALSHSLDLTYISRL